MLMMRRSIGSHLRRDALPHYHPVVVHQHPEVDVTATVGPATGNVRDRLVVDKNAQLQDDLEPRTRRAVNESMDISLLSEGGRYEVQFFSGNQYEVGSIAIELPDSRRESRPLGRA